MTKDLIDINKRAAERHPADNADRLVELEAENAVLREAMTLALRCLDASLFTNAEHDQAKRSLRTALNQAGPVVLVTSDVVKTAAKEAREKALEDAADRLRKRADGFADPHGAVPATLRVEAKTIRAMKEHTDD